ncbi:MAG: 3,4-dihydroxy-2-butanone-4-phosphate synthase [Gammaproteobacteria bacterium]|nr:3,4-dihydroxy-2-butanone-4-phosphate synthase [Gammaproteobacteria bacterium]
MPISAIQDIIDDIRLGRMVILMDDEDRENEGDLIIAAEAVTAEHITFFASHACGLICLPITEERARRLALPLMVQKNQSQHETNFTVSIDAAVLPAAGITSAGRAATVRAAIARDAVPTDIVQPGHIFPLVAKPGGVLTRAGHTEAGCDLARLAGFESAALIVEIVNEDGTMARRPQLEEFAARHELRIGTIADLIAYRALHDQTVARKHEREIDTAFGRFRLITYRDLIDGTLHFSLVKGEIDPVEPTLVRVHVLNLLRDIFQTERPGMARSWSLNDAMRRIEREGSGVVVLVTRRESPEDLAAQIEIFPDVPQARGTPSEKGHHFWRVNGTGSQILKDLGVHHMRLLSSPTRFSAISGFNLEITEFIENTRERQSPAGSC